MFISVKTGLVVCAVEHEHKYCPITNDPVYWVGDMEVDSVPLTEGELKKIGKTKTVACCSEFGSLGLEQSQSHR